MGFKKRFRAATSGIGKAIEGATGSKTAGRTTAIAAGGLIGLPLGPASIPAALAANEGYSQTNRQETRTAGLLAEAEKQFQETEIKNAQIAEQTRLKLLAEEDIKRKEEEEKKRTTFAGTSIQAITERKKLLGA